MEYKLKKYIDGNGFKPKLVVIGSDFFLWYKKERIVRAIHRHKNEIFETYHKISDWKRAINNKNIDSMSVFFNRDKKYFKNENIFIKSFKVKFDHSTTASIKKDFEDMGIMYN